MSCSCLIEVLDPSYIGEEGRDGIRATQAMRKTFGTLLRTSHVCMTTLSSPAAVGLMLTGRGEHVIASPRRAPRVDQRKFHGVLLGEQMTLM